MTVIVSFHFDSPQFAFRSGFIAFLKGARLRSDGEISTGEITDGIIDGVLVEGPIDFDAMLYQLSVTRKADQRPYDVACLWVTGSMTTEAIGSGRIAVDLNLPVLLVIRVEDLSGALVPAVVSLSLPSPTATFEVPLDGELVLFGTPGHHSIRVISAGDRQLAHERIGERFEVSEDESGERAIVLRVPPVRRV